jgi:hypothetical protein
MRKIRIAAAAAFAGLALMLGFALPAQAAGAPEIPGTEANTFVSFERTVQAEGGQEFTVRGTWGETYPDDAGNIRVTLFDFEIEPVGPLGRGEGDLQIDAKVKVYSGYADGHLNRIQYIIWDGADNPIRKNLRNPLNRPHITQIRVGGVGWDGDGLKGSGWITIYQPVIGGENPGPDPTG